MQVDHELVQGACHDLAQDVLLGLVGRIPIRIELAAVEQVA
jgi:hypothetical protein